MNIGTIAHFFIEHNGTIFGVTATVVCVLSIFVVWLNVFRRNTLVTGEKPDFDFGEIEKSLKKILSQTHATIQNVENSQSAGASTSAASAGNPAEVSALKKELEDRVKIIEDLKAQVEKAKSDDGSAALLAKIKTLEGKLAEYEIIEDDIADLSHFKEENARLKKELDGLKRGGPELVDQFAAAVNLGQAPAGPATVVTGAPQAPGQTIAVGGPTPAGATTAPTAQTPPAPSEPTAVGEAARIRDAQAAKKAEASLEDVVAKAQEQAKEMPGIGSENPGTPGDVIEFSDDGSAKKTAAEAPKAPAAAPAPAAAAASQKGPTPTNIFAEFTGDAEDSKDPLAELGEIDTNRMLEELKDLNMDMNVGAEALEEAPDMEKMASEAQNLNKK